MKPCSWYLVLGLVLAAAAVATLFVSPVMVAQAELQSDLGEVPPKRKMSECHGHEGHKASLKNSIQAGGPGCYDSENMFDTDGKHIHIKIDIRKGQCQAVYMSGVSQPCIRVVCAEQQDYKDTGMNDFVSVIAKGTEDMLASVDATDTELTR